MGLALKGLFFPANYANLNGANIGTSSVLHRFFGCLTPVEVAGSIAMASLWGYAEAIPYTLTIFPEGTRLTEAKLVDSQERQPARQLQVAMDPGGSTGEMMINHMTRYMTIYIYSIYIYMTMTMNMNDINDIFHMLKKWRNVNNLFGNTKQSMLVSDLEQKVSIAMLLEHQLLATICPVP